MDANRYPAIWPNMIPAFEAALQKHEESVAKLAEFKKRYTSVKNKAKRIETSLIKREEEFVISAEYMVTDCLRLAENKFILINKKLKYFKEHEEKSCKKSLKLLKGSVAIEPGSTQWHIQQVSYYNYKANDLIHEVSDMLRIAKGHLIKVDDFKKFIAQLNKRRRSL